MGTHLLYHDKMLHFVVCTSDEFRFTDTLTDGQVEGKL